MATQRTADKATRALAAAGLDVNTENLAGGYFGTMVRLDGAEFLLALDTESGLPPVWFLSREDTSRGMLTGHGEPVDIGRVPLADLAAAVLRVAPAAYAAPVFA